MQKERNEQSGEKMKKEIEREIEEKAEVRKVGGEEMKGEEKKL